MRASVDHSGLPFGYFRFLQTLRHWTRPAMSGYASNIRLNPTTWDVRQKATRRRSWKRLRGSQALHVSAHARRVFRSPRIQRLLYPPWALSTQQLSMMCSNTSMGNLGDEVSTAVGFSNGDATMMVPCNRDDESGCERDIVTYGGWHGKHVRRIFDSSNIAHPANAKAGCAVMWARFHSDRAGHSHISVRCSLQSLLS